MKNLSLILPVFAFLILFSVFSLIGLYLGNQTLKNFEEKENTSIDSEMFQMTSLIEDKINEYSNVLYASKSFFNSSDVVNRSEWNSFVTNLNLKENYPSISRLVYVKKVEPEEKESYENKVKSDISLSPSGYPNFQIFPSTNESSYVVHYAEPLTGIENLLGFDLYSNISRKEAIILSRDLNSVVMTEPIVFIQDDQSIKSLILFIPIYKSQTSYQTLEQRRENIDGLIMLAFSIDNLLDEVSNTLSLVRLDSIKIEDITKEPLILVPRKELFAESEMNSNLFKEKLFRRNIATRNWLISYGYSKSNYYNNLSNNISLIIIILGFIISILGSIWLFFLTKLKFKAEDLVGDLSKDLIKYKLAIKNISEQIVISDKDGIVLFANSATERITGYSSTEIVGTKAGKLWGNLMTKEYYKKLWQTIKVDKLTFFSEITNKRKNGEKYTAEIKISPILDKNGEVEFFVASERDVTNIRKIDQIKTQFISLASHQLRTPLSSIKWNTEMLIKGEIGTLDDEQKDVLKNIYQAIQRMITLVNNLLNVSTIESGKLVINPEPTNLIEVAKEIVINLKEALDKKKISLNTNFQLELSQVNVDSDLIKEVLINLLTNAVKYSKVGGSIGLSIKQIEGYVIAEIKDDGIGIPLKDQSSIFNKFSRGSNVLKADADGSGLGLYMTKIIIESSNGKIWFESSEDVGTTFWFSIPIYDVIKKDGDQKIKKSSIYDELHI